MRPSRLLILCPGVPHTSKGASSVLFYHYTAALKQAGFTILAEAFVRQIRTGERGEAGDFQAGLRAQTLVQAALNSVLERRAVNVPLPAKEPARPAP